LSFLSTGSPWGGGTTPSPPVSEPFFENQLALDAIQLRLQAILPGFVHDREGFGEGGAFFL